MIEVVYKPTFIRKYKKLPAVLQEEVKERIALFQESPSHSYLKTHKLKGQFKGFYSFSVNYSYRIIFQYEGENKVALVSVGDHTIYQ